MIYIQIHGGLGNQMFQYAAALSLARTKKTAAGFSLERLNELNLKPEITKREFELERVFDISNLKFVTSSHYNYIISPKKSVADRVKKLFRRATFLFEKSLAYDSGFEHLSGECYLEGYFQSYKYFDVHLNSIKSNFRFKNVVSDKTSEQLLKIENKNSIAVHVRRGDFVEIAKNTETHGVCSMLYYQAAVEQFKNIPDACFVIVSDDAEWVKANFKLKQEAHIVDWNQGVDSWQDMLIISKCKHAIIANSSFSWWGAYLIDNPSKIIVAPKIWYADTKRQAQTIDLIPPDWIRM